MFKKELTYFTMYIIDGNINNKYSIYMDCIFTSDINASSLKNALEENCKLNHEANFGIKPIKLNIISIQLISVQISLFGFRIF